MHKIKVKQFEGPLDLLLQLIENEKLEITEVSLAEVTEQYIQILNQESKDGIPAGHLADFLVVAARLLLIKSRALLPFLQWEEDEGEELTNQLKIYRQYLEASKVVASIISKKKFSFSRQHLLTGQEITFSPPPKLKADKLREIFAQVLKALEPVVNLPTDVIKRTISIQEKIAQIRQRIFRQANAKFSEILKEAKDKTEVIVSFLALLELVKQKIVKVKQDEIFQDILIEKNS